MGLGAVGPKSGRFGETPVLLNSEMWYLDYLWQAGFFGLLVLLVLAGVIVRGLWRGRASPMARAALAVMVGLAVGALFIPVIDEPAIAVPMWTLIAFGLLASERAGTPGDPVSQTAS
jgi:O-antigen ligase